MRIQGISNCYVQNNSNKKHQDTNPNFSGKLGYKFGVGLTRILEGVGIITAMPYAKDIKPERADTVDQVINGNKFSRLEDMIFGHDDPDDYKNREKMTDH